MRDVPTVLVLASALAFAASPALVVPDHLAAQAPAPPADSVEVHRAAREAQARFERVRRRNLPVALGRGGGGCEERVGRFCFRHTPGYRWRPPAEKPVVVDSRGDLLTSLAEAADDLPGDRWILGQRIRYLLEDARWHEALELVSGSCVAHPPSTCHELRGMALHLLGRYDEAAEAFRRTSPEGDALPSPGPVVDASTRALLEGASAEEAGRLLELFWWLADPLRLVAGNDRLTEHRSREIQARLREDAASPWSIPWGDDLTELLLRYGVEVGWQRSAPEPLRGGELGIVGHQDPDGRQFVPPAEVLEDPWNVEPGAWTPEFDRPRSAYAPAYARDFRSGVGRVSILREGDSIVVHGVIEHPPPPSDTGVVGGDPEGRLPGTPGDSLLPWTGRPEQVGLFLRGADGSEFGRSGPAADGAGLLIRVPAGRYVVSLERWDPRSGIASRIRQGLVEPARPPDRAVLSDLILLDPGAGDPDTPEALLARTRIGSGFRPGEQVAVAWLLSGLGWRGEETIRYRLSLEPAGRGILRRAGEWLGVLETEEGLALEWSEAGPGRPAPVLRSVDVTIPAVPPGRYRLVLRVDLPGRSPLRAEREIRVAEDPPGR